MHQALTHRLLAAGILAGPLVLAVEFTLAATREGFDWQRHASSQLALGDGGWMQALNFVVAGVLMLAFALGLHRALRNQPGGRWAAWLMAVFALSHVGVGLFSTDPAFGFPPGPDTPAGLPAYHQASTHALLHSLFGLLGFLALAAACALLAWHFRRRGETGWALVALLPTLAVVAISVYAGHYESRHSEPAVRATAQFDFRPMWAGLPLIWGALSALAWALRRRA
ncbi:DUF998 domain-containing protein [Stagnimonas aquatica]|uniref:DUF998 domain-containing protein n=1 Tax=Stagnimonas aquatica TaxID=2689987 RepID=A0A3N0VH48_9GAMM|nr:DUF998 domain-containing protein [Stagnimonas aquatica]ROH92079.1 DUF998 domain-containing protein [Stagnimonas aquatica]